MANDPPRDDIDEVWISGATLDESLVPTEQPMGTFHRFAAQHMLLSDALYALLRSLERHEGPVDAGNDEAAAAQTDAARQNAQRAADLQNVLTDLAVEMNGAIAAVRAGGPGFGALSLEDVVALYNDSYGNPPSAPGDALQNVANSVSGAAEDLLEPFDPVAAHPILSATELPPDRDVPFDGEFVNELAESSATLRNLVQG